MAVKIISIIIAGAALFIFLAKQTSFTLTEPVLKLSQSINTAGESYIPKKLTLEQIFSGNHTLAGVPKEKIRTIIATGDVIPARSVNFKTSVLKDFKWPYLKTAEELKNADITLINLESPLIGNCPLTNEGMIFCGDAGNIEGLTYAGVDIVNLANNHMANFGPKGIESSIDLLKKSVIAKTGIGQPEILDIRGIKFAFLGYNDISKPQAGIANADEEKIKSDISDVKAISDVVIVSFHWGTEYKEKPEERQKFLGHLAIDAGADLIIGNHPHWIQPVEIYKGKLIAYAHGNFIFDQMWSEKTREGVVGKYTFYGKQLIDVEYMPIKINNYGQPYFLEGSEKSKILNNLKLQSGIPL